MYYHADVAQAVADQDLDELVRLSKCGGGLAKDALRALADMRDNTSFHSRGEAGRKLNQLNCDGYHTRYLERD